MLLLLCSGEIEEELAPLSEAEAKAVESYDDQVNKTRVAAKDLSWLHLLGEIASWIKVVST